MKKHYLIILISLLFILTLAWTGFSNPKNDLPEESDEETEIAAEGEMESENHIPDNEENEELSTAPENSARTSSKSIVPMSFNSFTPPPAGEEFEDPAFGTQIRRLTDAQKEGYSSITHAYSSVSPFNANSTLVLLEKSGGILHIRDLEGKVIRDNLNSFGILPTGDPLWSRTNPNLIYFHTAGGNEIKSYNVSSNEVRRLSTLDQYSEIRFGNGEGDISADGNHIPILADDRFGLLYNVKTGGLSRPVDTVLYGKVDAIDVTPANKLLFSSTNPEGFYLTNALSAGRPINILDHIGHSDHALNEKGNGYLVVTNSNDSSPIPDCQNGIVKVDWESPKEDCLQELDWSLAVHISCNNFGQNWCLVSTYSTNSPSGNWPAFTNELLKVSLGGSRTMRLAHTQSSSESYVQQPRASVSPDGKYALFASDMQGDFTDTYLLLLD
jgi:hypothetical protein